MHQGRPLMNPQLLKELGIWKSSLLLGLSLVEKKVAFNEHVMVLEKSMER